MSWKNIIKFDGHEKSPQQIIETYDATIELLQTVKKDMEELVTLIQGDGPDADAAHDKWHNEMKGGIMDVEGSFGVLTDIHEYITRLLGGQ